MTDNIIISDNFCGGNIKVLNCNGDRISLAIDNRDSEPWCYWAFRVQGAARKKLFFDFGLDAVGYFGAAVSYDLESWHWSDVENFRENEKDRYGFSYSFGQNENDVYFAHNFQYLPCNFQKLSFLEHKTLCVDEYGNNVPMAELGNGKKTILMTARHHACEAPANYILHGVLEEMRLLLPDEYRIICVPFVDYNGVISGDQGKGRAPHDHNRDYNEKIGNYYDSVAAIVRIIKEENVIYAFDFHSPCHLGGGNDLPSFACSYAQLYDETKKLSALYVNELSDGCFIFPDGNISQPKTPTKGTFQTYVGSRENTKYAVTMENPYFGTKDNIMTDKSYIKSGNALARAIIKFIEN